MEVFLMSTGAVILLVAVLAVFVFEAISLVVTIVKKRKTRKQLIAENKSEEEVKEE